jgi:hypothetical protein
MVTYVATHKQTEDVDNRAQRRTSECKIVEVTERWSIIHNKKLVIYNPRQILEGLSNKEHRLGRLYHEWERKESFLVNPGGERSLGRHKFRWDDNIKKGLKQAVMVMLGFN